MVKGFTEIKINYHRYRENRQSKNPKINTDNPAYSQLQAYLVDKWYTELLNTEERIYYNLQINEED